MFKYFFLLILFVFSCEKKTNSIELEESESKEPTPKTETRIYTDGFDFPVGIPDAENYYNAQKFQENYHLGEDWNGINGGNSDLGDTIYIVANGYVKFAQNIHGGWGNVIRVNHYTK